MKKFLVPCLILVFCSIINAQDFKIGIGSETELMGGVIAPVATGLISNSSAFNALLIPLSLWVSYRDYLDFSVKCEIGIGNYSNSIIGGIGGSGTVAFYPFQLPREEAKIKVCIGIGDELSYYRNITYATDNIQDMAFIGIKAVFPRSRIVLRVGPTFYQASYGFEVGADIRVAYYFVF